MRRYVVTGGAGFIGSHLCQALLERGDAVVCVDDFSSGSLDNVADFARSGRFELVEGSTYEVLGSVGGTVDAVAHLASPASPVDYLAHPLETLAAGSSGTEAALRLAHAHGARFLLSSTSEVYGDPLVHPQQENYWGNVNPIGPRSVYDESKRFSEALTAAYRRTYGVDTGIVRIFNTYGPRLRPGDGRVVSNQSRSTVMAARRVAFAISTTWYGPCSPCSTPTPLDRSTSATPLSCGSRSWPSW